MLASLASTVCWVVSEPLFVYLLPTLQSNWRRRGGRGAGDVVQREKINRTVWLSIFSLQCRSIAFPAAETLALSSFSYSINVWWSTGGRKAWYNRGKMVKKPWRSGSSWFFLGARFCSRVSPTQKRGAVFVVLRVFLELNIFTGWKTQFCSVDKLGISQKQKQKF